MESKMVNKKKKKEVEKVEEDRISDLPDSIIQHILSFLPSTKQSIQTCILSKRWRNQWTRVPVLVFDFDGKFRKKFLKFIDNALLLHDCPKIHKFHLQYCSFDAMDARFTEKIHFATSKYVADLYLSSFADELLPEFLFNYALLVKLSAHHCCFLPKGKVNWGCLSSLEIAFCKLPCQALEHILSGSPSLKSLELKCCALEKIVIASKSLKRLLIYYRDREVNISVLEISCPNLEELCINHMATEDPQLFAQAIENVLFVSLLLESFELIGCREFDHLVIASNSLKKFVLGEGSVNEFDIEISCPRLEELKLLGYLNVKTAKLLNLPSSLHATIDFKLFRGNKACKSLVIDTLQLFQQFNELKIGSWFLEIMSSIKVGGRFSLVLNVKCLAVDSPYLVKHHPGIACLLHISPVLEKLVINVREPRYCQANHTNIGKNYWDSNADVFDCLVSYLKTIEITGFPERVGRRENMLNLIKFLLKNARVLEKMVVILKKDHIGTASPSDLYQELSSLPRCSQKAIIEVVCF